LPNLSGKPTHYPDIHGEWSAAHESHAFAPSAARIIAPIDTGGRRSIFCYFDRCLLILSTYVSHGSVIASCGTS
jgi:hypothetical protein